MALTAIGHRVPYKWQGFRYSCWLTAIEMVMMYHFDCKYGVDERSERRVQHTDAVQLEDRRNKGSHICFHAADYGLEALEELPNGSDLGRWKAALKDGPIIASGKYGWVAAGTGDHVIVIIGLSRSDKLVFLNPNIMGFRIQKFWNREKYRYKYASRDRILDLACAPWNIVYFRDENNRESDTGKRTHPFYQVSKEVLQKYKNRQNYTRSPSVSHTFFGMDD